MNSNLSPLDLKADYGWDYYCKAVMPCGGAMLFRIPYCQDDAEARRVVRIQQKQHPLDEVSFYRTPADPY